VTDERREALCQRLVRRLNLEEPDEDVLVLLEDELEDAEAELLLYLNRETLPEALYPKVQELAALYARRDLADNPDLCSMSYSEGDTSQSETYLTVKDYRDQEDDLLSSVAHWRRRVAE
jgi:hypothetical protein